MLGERARLLEPNQSVRIPPGPEARFAQAVDYARRHDLLLCHDAPYCDVTFDGYVAPSLLQVDGASEVAVEFNSLSKTANMAGWRVGMAVGNADVLASLAQVKSNVDSGMFRPLQEAAVRALSADSGWLLARNGVYQERLEAIVAGLNAAGLQALRPRATLYAWAAEFADPWPSVAMPAGPEPVAPGQWEELAEESGKRY